MYLTVWNANVRPGIDSVTEWMFAALAFVEEPLVVRCSASPLVAKDNRG